MKNSLRNMLISCLMISGLLTGLLQAQSPPGRLSGTVKDDKGTLVPGVTIKATQLESGRTFQTYTDDNGQFVFPTLPGGTYRLDAEIIGLPKSARDGINVVSLQEAAANLILGQIQLTEKGAPAKTPPPGPGEAGRSGTWIPQRGQATSPPGSNGAANGARQRLQNFQNVTLTENSDMPDVTQGGPPTVGSDSGAGTAGGAEMGNQNIAENFLINGSVNTGAFQLTQQGPGEMGDMDRMERIRQFMQNADPAMMERIQQMAGAGGFGAFGGGPGGMRMGGPGGPGGPRMGGPGGFAGFGRNARVNKLQGSFFMDYHNAIFDAKPYSFQGIDQPRPGYSQNNFGASVGGPLNIPHLYQSKDRTSFFFNWQSQRAISPTSITTSVPTPAERQGDFSQAIYTSGPFAGQLIPIYDPLTGVAHRQTFAGNQIPAQRIDPIARALLQYIPLPNLPGQILNYHFEQSLPNNSDSFSGRLDHKVTNKDNLSFNYNIRRGDSTSSGISPTLMGTTSSLGQNFGAAYTHTFNERLLNSARFQFNRSRISSINNFAYTNDVAGSLGITGTSRNPIDYGVPTLSFTNFGGVSLPTPRLGRNQTTHFSDNITWVRGKHSFQIGGEYRRVDSSTNGGVNGRGSFSFSGFSTAAFDAQGNAIAGTGFDFADFLLGLPQSTSLRFGGDNIYMTSNVFIGYIQDNWRFNNRLSFSLGVRYEAYTPPAEKYDRISNLDIAPGFTAAAVVLPGQSGPFTGQFPTSLVNGDYNNFAPRFGFAYRPFAKRRTIIRGGYGIYFVPSIYNQIFMQLAGQPPFATTSQLLTSPSDVLTLQNGFPANPLPDITIRNSYVVDRNYQVGYAQQWNLSLQHEIIRNFVLELTYLGTKGSKLDLLRAPNRATTGSSLTTQNRLQISNAESFLYDTSGASSIYHAAQVRLQRRMTHGLGFQVMYIFGKSIDDASSIGSAGGGGTVVQDENNLRAERGLSSFDVRHRLNFNWFYQFPFGARKRWLSNGGRLSQVLGDWTMSSNTMMQSGSYFTPRVLGAVVNNSGTGSNQSERANYNGQPISLPGDRQSINQFFNTLAFVAPLPGEFGNAGRNIIEGPGMVNVNLSLNKTIPLRWEGKRVEFRTQVQNLFNHPNFAGLNTTVDSTNFGHLTSTRGMRTMEFSLRFRF